MPVGAVVFSSRLSSGIVELGLGKPVDFRAEKFELIILLIIGGMMLFR